MAQYVVGVDGGTESLRAGVFSPVDGVLLGSFVVPYATRFPQPGWAEQEPEDWWHALGEAVKGALAAARVDPANIAALCVDTTCCTVCALDEAGAPVRPALLWMDMRSAAEAARVAATKDPALRVNGGGSGPVSAEWMIPKALWIKTHEPESWSRAEHVCEYQDFINLRLTGQYVGSLNNASVRWHYDVSRGWPASLLHALDLDDLLSRWPPCLVPPGGVVGRLTPTAAAHTGLPPGLLVAQGGADAFIGMLGVGVVAPGQMALLTGSSHLHLGMADRQATGRGMFGSYTSAVLPGLHVVEGGQTSTGSIVAWFKRTLCGPPEAGVDYRALNEEAEAVPPGCDGLLCLDHFQGNRTPHTDALSRGALAGLTLAHTRGHVFRALLEGVAFGTRLILDTMAASGGYTPTSIAIAGGATRSPLWLQIHADVAGVPFVLTAQPEAPMLGCAILASVAAGLHPDVPSAAAAMVVVTQTVHPRPDAHTAYQHHYGRYCGLYPALAPLQPGRDVAALQPHSATPGTDWGACDVILAPSILAANFARLADEVSAVLDAGAHWVHVDMFDGSALARGNLTIGPGVLASLRKALPHAFLDCHLAVDDPLRYVDAVAAAGASSITFHLEAPGLLAPGARTKLAHDGEPNDPGQVPATAAMDWTPGQAAAALANYIRGTLGLRAGLALEPATAVDADVMQLVASGAVDMVLVMTVTPGWGGQAFMPETLPKVRALRAVRAAGGQQQRRLRIQVDGGINPQTGRQAAVAGADVFVAGSAVFGKAKAGHQDAGRYREVVTDLLARLREGAAEHAETETLHD